MNYNCFCPRSHFLQQCKDVNESCPSLLIESSLVYQRHIYSSRFLGLNIPLHFKAVALYTEPSQGYEFFCYFDMLSHSFFVLFFCTRQLPVFLPCFYFQVFKFLLSQIIGLIDKQFCHPMLCNHRII